MAAKPPLENLVWARASQAYSGVDGLRVAEPHHVREDAQADVPLLLMCAEDNEVSLVHLVDALNRSGRAPEVIAGVEHDATLLSSATDRTGGAALFVLCQSDELDRSQVLQLSGLFSARRGPLHELLVVDVDGSASLDALPLIEAAMESVSRASPASAEASAARASRVPKRDVVVMPGDSAGPDVIPKLDAESSGERQLRLHPETPRASAALELEDAEEQAAQEPEEQAAREAEEQAAPEAEAQAAREAEERAALEAEERAALEAEEQAEAQAARDAAERKVRENAEALARAFHEEMVAAEAVLERRSSRRGAPAHADAPSSALGDGVPVRLEPELDETRQLGLEQPLSIEAPELSVPLETAAQEPSGPATESEPGPDSRDELGPLSTSLSGVRVAAPLASSPIPETIQTELTPTDTRRRRREPEQTDTHSPAPTHEARESRGGWLLAIAGAAALGGLALFVVRGGSGEDAGQRAASVAAVRSGGTRASASQERRPVAEASTRPTPLAAPQTKPEPEEKADPAVEPEPQEKADPAVEPEAQEKADPAVEPEAQEKADPAVESQSEPEDPSLGPLSTVPPAPTDSEALRVDLAIRKGRIRALDSLLIARPGTEAMDWAQAKAVCRRNPVGGLPGWRLPSRRQLKRLMRARRIGSGTYWSRDRGPHDDDAFALDAESGESHVYLAVEPAGLVQCVRKR